MRRLTNKHITERLRKQTIRDNDCGMNHYKAFAATYATQHAVPALVKRQPTDDPPTLWKVMHHPEWEFEPHKEGDEFYKEGEYWVCDGKPSTPSAITSRIKEEATGGGHRFVMRPRSIFGKKGKRLKTGCSRNLDELRFGKVTGWTLPDDTRLQKDGWLVFKVEWDTDPSPLDLKYKNKGQKAITEMGGRD